MKRIFNIVITLVMCLGIYGLLRHETIDFGIQYENGEQLIEAKPINQNSDFRAVWVTTLTGDIASFSNVTQYKAEMNKVFSVMEYYNMNVMVFHIRTHNNALYKSSLNPVASYYRNVDFDVWDPITWIIEECHKRGMEFHAWLNPYRCSTTFSGTTAEYAANQPIYNVASNSENLLKTSNGIILNPGEPAVRDFVVNTCMEVIERYDVDAIHFDDYFYASGIDDTHTRQKYNQEGLSVGDFRRKQVDLFIEKLSQTMRAYNIANNRLVQLGVAPTGIYRNAGPSIEFVYDSNGNLVTPVGSETGGFEHYGDYLYCDTKKWIDNEWIDYIIPQSYWGFSHPVAGFIKVMSWWAQVVKFKDVNLYSGMGIYMAGSSNTYSWVTDLQEASKQIDYCNTLPEVQGHCLFSYKHIESAYDNIPGRYLENMKKVKENNWTKPALIPEIRTYDAISLPSVGNVVVVASENGYQVEFSKVNQAKFYAIYRGVEEITFTNDELVAVVGSSDDLSTVSYLDTNNTGQLVYGVKPISLTNTLGVGATSTISSESFKVVFLDFDDTILKTQYLPSGFNAVPPTTPNRIGYDFVGWDKEYLNVTENMEIKAQYAIKMLQVTFQDGSTILSTQQVPYGGNAVINDPIKEGHTFDGWDKNLENIKTNLVVNASFTPYQYTVLFLGRDGLALKNEVVSYGQNATAPVIEDEHFVGWDIAFIDVEADLIIKPIFDDAYQITFVIDEEVVLIVNDAKGSFGVPLIPAKVGYDQIPPTWSLSDFSNINEDVIVSAQYTINSYTVIFVGLNNKELKTEIVEWQKPALAPTNTEEKNYTFKGWDREFSSITENMVVKAEYEQAKSSCSNLSLANLSFAFLALAWLIIKRKHN